MKTRGIILAGGSGSRLSPLTRVYSKQLVNVYNKPLFFYPLSTLIGMGIKEISIISTKQSIIGIQQFYGDGETLGIKLHYRVQENPDGIPQAFTICEDDIMGGDVVLILGDNVLLDRHRQLPKLVKGQYGIFTTEHSNPSAFGVVEKTSTGSVKRLIEKPATPPTNTVSIGLYYLPEACVSHAKQLRFSSRNELEMADLLNNLLREGLPLMPYQISDQTNWFDCGTFEALHDCSTFVRHAQNTLSSFIGFPEISSYEQNFIDGEHFRCLANFDLKSTYGEAMRSYARKQIDQSN